MTQKQEFLGGLIAGAVVKKGIEAGLDFALKKAAASKSISLDAKDVPAVKEIVTESVEKEMQSRSDHVTDNEANYKSRNVWGSIVGIVTFIETFRMAWTDNVEQTPTQWLAIVGILVTALTPLYSRFFAKKPLGE